MKESQERKVERRGRQDNKAIAGERVRKGFNSPLTSLTESKLRMLVLKSNKTEIKPESFTAPIKSAES